VLGLIFLAALLSGGLIGGAIVALRADLDRGLDALARWIISGVSDETARRIAGPR
jgi:hypothetical protein